MDTCHTQAETVLGRLTLVAGDGALTRLFPGYRYTPSSSSPGRRVDAPADPVPALAESERGEYFAGNRRVFDVPAGSKADEFQQRAWARPRKIPFGERVTCGDITAGLGDKALAQPVGQAAGRNLLSIIISCHRVVGAGGKLTGFGGWLTRKHAVLGLEEPAGVRAGRLF